MKLTQSTLTGVVNVLFLRYINPALVTPERYKLVPKRAPNQKLGLQIAKLLQALVNAAMCERFTPVPDTLVSQANKDNFNKFLTDLTHESQLLTLPASDPTWVDSAPHGAQALATIRDFMIRNIHEVFSAAFSSAGSAADAASAASLRNGLQQFVSVCLMEVHAKRA